MKPLLIESNGHILQDYIQHFSYFACQKLGINDCPPIKLVSKTGSSSFGNYHISTKVITIATDGRHIADILRTLAHELVHESQHLHGQPECSLEELEYEANAIAGMIMREYNKLHPELYDATDIESDDTLEDMGNPGAAQGSLENSGVTVDRFQAPSYQEGGLSSDPMRPTSHVELAEEGVKSTDSDSLKLLKLQNMALRAFPSSPKQKEIQQQINVLREKMKKENTPEYHQTLKNEEAPVNSVGSGAVEGMGFGPKGEPGIHPSKKNKPQVLKRKTLEQLRQGLK